MKVYISIIAFVHITLNDVESREFMSLLSSNSVPIFRMLVYIYRIRNLYCSVNLPLQSMSKKELRFCTS